MWEGAQPPPQPHPDSICLSPYPHTVEKLIFSGCQSPEFILCIYPTFFSFFENCLFLYCDYLFMNFSEFAL